MTPLFTILDVVLIGTACGWIASLLTKWLFDDFYQGLLEPMDETQTDGSQFCDKHWYDVGE